MKQQIREVRAGGPTTEQFHIQHQGKPGQRMPIPGSSRGKGPGHIRSRQAVENVGIGGEIRRVIVNHEVAMLDGLINHRHRNQQQTKQDRIGKGAD